MAQNINTLNMSRREWLEERRKGIGGSDAAAIMGLNPWRTPYAVWADKTGQLPEKEDTESMRQGRDLEDYVAHRFMESTGKKVRRRNQIIKNDQYPFAFANVDRMVAGENAGLECKTTSVLNLKKFKNGDFPDTYYCQCVHYMAITGADRWYLAVLVFGSDFKVFTIERDQEEIDALMAEEQYFWDNFVKKNMPPPVDGYLPTTEAINVIYKDAISDSTPVDLFGRESIFDNLANIKARIKELKRDQEEYEQIIKSDLGQNEYGQVGKYSVSWKAQSRTTFDHKKFVADNPNIDLSNYYKTSTSRVLRIKEAK